MSGLMADQAPSYLYRWFAEPLSRMLPAWVQAMFLGVATARRIEFRENARQVEVKSRHIVAPVEAITEGKYSDQMPHNKNVDVSLPPALFLKREITAPKSAARSLPAVAQLDLQRRTPFQLPDVFWVIGEINHQGPEIKAVQWVVRKADIASWRNRLLNRQLRLRRVYIQGAEAAGPIADFSREIAPSQSRWQLINGALVLATLLFVAFAWLYPAWAIRPQIRQLETQSATRQTEALRLRQDVDRLRAQQLERAAFLDFIGRRPLLSEALRELTIALPDSVWLETMLFRTNRIVINGETSGSAAELVLELSKKAHFGNPRLTGPVSNTSLGAERFEITMDAGDAR